VDSWEGEDEGEGEEDPFDDGDDGDGDPAARQRIAWGKEGRYKALLFIAQGAQAGGTTMTYEKLVEKAKLHTAFTEWVGCRGEDLPVIMDIYMRSDSGGKRTVLL
jgi:hypothetical protein